MINLLYCLTDLLFFDILLYYYINLKSSIIFFFFWRYDLSSGISLLNAIFYVSQLFCGEAFEVFVILFAILLPTKSPVGSAVF